VATPRAYPRTRPRESTGCTAGREGVVLVLESSPKSCEENPDWDRGRMPVVVADRVPRRVARRKLPDAPLPPPARIVYYARRHCEYFASAYLSRLAWKMAGSVSISKPNRSEASLEPQLFRKSVREFRLKITREVRMSQLRLENPSTNPGE